MDEDQNTEDEANNGKDDKNKEILSGQRVYSPKEALYFEELRLKSSRVAHSSSGTRPRSIAQNFRQMANQVA